MTLFERALKRYRFKFNSALMGRAVLACLLIFLASIHIYYASWLGFGERSTVLPYINMTLRTGTALFSIFLLLRAYNRLWADRKTSRWMDITAGNS